MRLDRLTLHSWADKEVTIRSEEDWVLGFYKGRAVDRDSLVGPGIWVVSKALRNANDPIQLAKRIVDDFLKEPLGITDVREFDYTVDILAQALPFML